MKSHGSTLQIDSRSRLMSEPRVKHEYRLFEGLGSTVVPTTYQGYVYVSIKESLDKHTVDLTRFTNYNPISTRLYLIQLNKTLITGPEI